jgi:hypothetical protein
MTHQDIEQRDIVDLYVRGRLNEEDKRAFEEHFFACDSCFDEVQTAQRMADGVRHAVHTGLLPEIKESAVAPWWRPAFAFSAVACACLVGLSAYLWMVEIPRLRNEVQVAKSQAEAEHQKLALARPPALPEGNLPLVMLEASRASGQNTLTIPASASQVALWIEPGSASFDHFALELSDAGGRAMKRVDGLAKNSYGAVSIVIPSEGLSAGKYRARLSGIRGGATQLIGEYSLEIRR